MLLQMRLPAPRSKSTWFGFFKAGAQLKEAKARAARGSNGLELLPAERKVERVGQLIALAWPHRMKVSLTRTRAR